MTGIFPTGIFPDAAVREAIRTDTLWACGRVSSLLLRQDITHVDGVCPECGRHVSDMSPEERDEHVVRKGAVLVGCEGYFLPLLLEVYRTDMALADRGWRFQTRDRVAAAYSDDLVGTVISTSADGRYVLLDWDADSLNGPYEDEVWHNDLRHVHTRLMKEEEEK